MSVDMVAEKNPNHKLFLNDCIKSECANTALNQRIENEDVGTLRLMPGVNATRQTTTSGARTNRTTIALKPRASNPFFFMMDYPRAFL